MAQKGNNKDDKDLQFSISCILKELGIFPNILGYKYLIEAIKYATKNEVYGVTIDLYPHVAQKFHTTPSRVERAIRHALEFVLNNPNELEKYFGKNVMKQKITNSMFIATIADYLNLQ